LFRNAEPFARKLRLISMGVALRAVPDQADLHNYRSAFTEFAGKVRQTRALMAGANPDRQAIDAALLELEKAHVTYNRYRDLLAQKLLRSVPPAPVPDSLRALSDRVRAVAELRWELAGRPEGTAEDDWYRAEEIVRRSAAA
jgi:hypothetical protein